MRTRVELLKRVKLGTRVCPLIRTVASRRVIKSGDVLREARKRTVSLRTSPLLNHLALTLHACSC